MGDRSKISWTDATWNPVTGCTKVSTGCKHCYAERMFPRSYGKDRRFTDVRVHLDRLPVPLRWQKPRRVFVNSMSDLFHVSVPDAFLDRVMGVMAIADNHVFQVLTKRPERMRAYMDSINPSRWCGIVDFGFGLMQDCAPYRYRRFEQIEASPVPFPPRNVAFGTSCENQDAADERLPHLLRARVAHRFVSCEPLLGPIDLTHVPYLERGETWYQDPLRCGIEWVIVGGESGPNHRPMDPKWAHDLRSQCLSAGVPFFFKQDSGPRSGMREDLLGSVIQEVPSW